jgi:hypothetical protein
MQAKSSTLPYDNQMAIIEHPEVVGSKNISERNISKVTWNQTV